MELCCPGCVCHTAVPQQINGNLCFFIFFSKYQFPGFMGVLWLSSVFNWSSASDDSDSRVHLSSS